MWILQEAAEGTEKTIAPLISRIGADEANVISNPKLGLLCDLSAIALAAAEALAKLGTRNLDLLAHGTPGFA
ncbi:MAG TPA: hypothetical protein VMC06_02410 [Opitutaceae bacterium]|nr:hypothetical protein [Opitutaceae bacterium]